MERLRSGDVGTEELRVAVINYRALIDDLLRVDEPQRGGPHERTANRTDASVHSRHRERGVAGFPVVESPHPFKRNRGTNSRARRKRAL